MLQPSEIISMIRANIQEIDLLGKTERELLKVLKDLLHDVNKDLEPYEEIMKSLQTFHFFNVEITHAQRARRNNTRIIPKSFNCKRGAACYIISTS